METEWLAVLRLVWASDTLDIPSNAAANGLKPPAKSVVEAASAPENEGGDDPSPEELPEHRRPPLPALAGSSLLLGRCAVDFGSRDAKLGVELARDDEHEEGKEQLLMLDTMFMKTLNLVMPTWKAMPAHTRVSILVV